MTKTQELDALKGPRILVTTPDLPFSQVSTVLAGLNAISFSIRQTSLCDTDVTCIGVCATGTST